MKYATLASLVLLATPASAWSDMDRITFGGALGQVLGSEEACGLSFDQEAVAALIEAKVPADDMQFTGILVVMTRGAEAQIDTMGQSAKTAHCAQIKRVAKSYKFVD